MKEQFFAKLAELVALAKDFPPSAFDEAAPEETTKHQLIRPLLKSLGYDDQHIVPEFKIVGDQVDYLLKSDRPLLFLEAKSLIDAAPDLFEGHKPQVLGYIRNYRVSPEQAQMDRPVTWIILSNFKEWHFIRVTEEKPSFSFKLNELISRREELWELLARENAEAGRIEELYDQSHKADLDKRFLADLKRWRLIIANGFALRNRKRSLDDLTLASQQLLDRFIFCRMLETHRLIEWNKLARAFTHYDEVSGGFTGKTFAEFLREWLFQEIKFKFNTELFQQPLLCDELAIDNEILATVIGHEPLHADIAATCGIPVGQGELFPFRHLYLYDFSRMSQDIMGAVYERFLAHRLFQDGGRIVIEDTDELRKKEGIYYTPRYIVDYIVTHTLGEKIKPILAEALTLLGYKNYKGAAAKIRELKEIKVLDPAMGSGSFLLRAFDKLVDAYAEYNAACRKAKAERGNGSGMLFDADAGIAEEIDHLGIRVATENIFGVDLDAQAIEVAKLNLWMRLMAVERDFIRGELQKRGKGSRPLNFLPDLRKNLRRGNSLIADKAVAGDAGFDWQTEFAETMKNGGFDVVIGNPPYVMVSEENCGKKAMDYYATLPVAEYKTDLFHLFIQRAIDLARTNGTVGYIVPNPWLTLQFTSKLRNYVLTNTSVRQLVVFDHFVFQEADVHTCLIVLDKRTAPESHQVALRHPPDENIEGAEQKLVLQKSWLRPPAFVMETRLTGPEKELIERLVSKFPPLETVARASLGCQAYNSSKHTAEQIEKRVFHSDHKAGPEYLPELAGNDVGRYDITREKGEWIKYGPWLHDYRTMDWLEGPRILIREIPGPPPYMIQACYVEETYCHYKTILNVNPAPKSKLSVKYLTGLLNSRLLSFVFPFVSNKMVAKSFPRLSVGDVKNLPVASVDFSDRKQKAKHDKVASLAGDRLSAHEKAKNLLSALAKRIHHSNRTPCNLAHYLQKDFADAVKPEILVDDVQRKGFVHEIRIASAGSQVTLSAAVADDAKSEPKPLLILRLDFKHEPLRQFIYALWRQFLDENSRKKKWTTGKKAEPIYPLLVNTLEPLVYFQPAAVDNLRAIRDLMKAAEKEAGSADLAALESEIEKLDREIDERVYELYGLTEDEIKIVEGRPK